MGGDDRACYRAAVVRAVHGPIRIEDVPVRAPVGDEVALRVTACGLCHSDVHFMHGTSGTAFPYVVGHEVAGRVVELGPDATGVAVGDTVVVAPMVPCGTCRQCAAGRPQACPDRLLRRPPIPLGDGALGTGVLGVGGLAERVLVPARNVVPIDPRVPPQVAALLGCGVPSGYGAAVHTAEVGPADDVVVIGCGGVGVAAVAGAAAAGAARIVAVDVSAAKLAAATAFGATDVVDASAADPVAAVRDLTGGRGADVVLDAVGGARTFATAVAMRAPGSRLVVVGAPKTGEIAELGLRELFLTGGSIRVSIWGDCTASRDLPLLAARYLDGVLPLDRYLSGTFALDEAQEGYDRLLAGEGLRGVVVL
ncbi:S-(hydroxymethyl)mycothiol dehydrogenase [Pseudonocardia thermophila]|uniref:S-(Hydroxymethyl)mycothiol dehydrogenase n=1 Tax=Pseudonocardia thermophila TaxID=1848 RepID=A0A1M6XZQ1_PSETH|nr:alcohol dehydrogenase catalytic domain-containing protein [Pseudonocardia thermophila]SHL11490.1 S-(hydroxymethyl)mycothiol dehydrogenase [Pseudonocardia thermophila]